MECPYCLKSIAMPHGNFFMGATRQQKIFVTPVRCPACDEISLVVTETSTGAITLQNTQARHLQVGMETVFFPGIELNQTQVYPRRMRLQEFQCVSKHVNNDFNEAREVLLISPKASAALSRRCLQAILREKEGISLRTLKDEIDEAISRNIYGKKINKHLDSIRKVGNAAAHPMNSGITGDLVEVQEDHAEFLIRVLLSILEHYMEESENDQALTGFSSQ